MAIDTASKRGSAAQAGRPITINGPTPTGSIDQAERQWMAHAYSGILARTSLRVKAIMGVPVEVILALQGVLF